MIECKSKSTFEDFCPARCSAGCEEPLLCISLEVPRLKTAPTAHRHRPALQPNLRLNTVPTTHSSIREVYKVRSSPTPIPPSNTQVYNVHIQNFFLVFVTLLRDALLRKRMSSFVFCPNEGGRALPNFFGPFQVHFWSIKGVYFLQNANNWNLKLFFRLYIYCIYSVFSPQLTFKS